MLAIDCELSPVCDRPLILAVEFMRGIVPAMAWYCCDCCDIAPNSYSSSSSGCVCAYGFSTADCERIHANSAVGWSGLVAD